MKEAVEVMPRAGYRIWLRSAKGKRVLAWQLEQAMAVKQVSKNQMAKAMQTSRSQLDRILDPDNDRVRLDTVIKAARVLGRQVRIELV